MFIYWLINENLWNVKIPLSSPSGKPSSPTAKYFRQTCDVLCPLILQETQNIIKQV